MNDRAVVPPVGPVRGGAIVFDRAAPGLTAVVIKGVLLSLVTFGIYRFWYITHLRRFFWSRTLVLGSPGEYVGRGKELFLGFLVALAILVPVYLILFLLTFAVPAVAPFSGAISFVFLFLLGQYALYRGRRYRASRTLWRGIRLSQDGSGFTYALRAAGLWVITLLSLGLGFPFMRAALERYRINHTLIGGSRMRSTARGTAILGPWLLFYLVGLGPIALAVLGLLIANDFSIPTDLLITDPKKAGSFIPNPAYRGTPIVAWGIAVAVVASIFLPLAALLIPFYRARETRAFMNAAFLGEAGLSCRLRARQFYWPYFLYMLSLFAFTAIVGIIAGILIGLSALGGNSATVQALAGLAVALLYFGMLLGFAVLYVRVITVQLWHAVAATTTVTNPQAVETVLASATRPGSGLNEGLADALDVGGALEIGF